MGGPQGVVAAVRKQSAFWDAVARPQALQGADGEDGMAKRFTERLRQKADSIWELQHQHPFVRGIGDETLT